MRGFSDNLQSLFGFYAADALRGMLNRPLASITLSEDKEWITFHFQDGGAQSFRVEGDCCSYSWIEHFTAPDAIAGAVITDVREALIDETEQDYESIKVYNTTFVTDRGDVVLEYRNSSNGYYGGYLVAIPPEGEAKR